MDYCRGRSSVCRRPGYGVSPLGGGFHQPTIEPPELTQDWGNRLLEGTNKTLCTPGPRRKERWPHKRLTQTCPWVYRSLQHRCGSVVACHRVGGTECSSVCMGPSEGGHHYFHYLHNSLASGQIRGREGTKLGPSTENWIKDLLSTLHPSEQDPVSLSVSLSHQEASISLLSFSIRDRMKTTV